MSWTLVPWVWRIHTPLHIGAGSAGNLQITRTWIPGRAVWGAVVNRIVHGTEKHPSRSHFDEWGGRIKSDYRWGPLWPARMENGDLCMLESSEQDRWRLIDSRASTSLRPDGNAEEGSLHETEILLSQLREGGGLYFVGWYATRGQNWDAEHLPELQFGGDRSRIGGWAAQEQYNSSWENTLKGAFQHVHLTSDEDSCCLELDEGLLRFPVIYDEKSREQVEGSVSLDVGRLTLHESRHGASVHVGSQLFQPGSRLKKKSVFTWDWDGTLTIKG